jgi:hypothetical protein
MDNQNIRAIIAMENTTIHAMIHTQHNNLITNTRLHMTVQDPTRLHLVLTMHTNSQLRIIQYNGEWNVKKADNFTAFAGTI